MGCAQTKSAYQLPTELHKAVSKGDTSRVKELLDDGAAINTTNHYGVTPLMMACEDGNEPMFDLLISQWADVK